MNNTKAVSFPTPIRILHIDDDADFLELAKQIIRISGDFIVDSALSVDEGFEKLKTQPYDVVLCDYEMQGKDGLQFLRELRDQKNDVAFMLFTGKGREEVAITALNLGADGYYNKHGSTETVFGELLHGIKAVTEERRTERALEEREMHYRTLMDQAADIILVLEYPPEGLPIIRDANSAALKIHGYTMEELYGKPITFIDKYIDEKKILNFAHEIRHGESIAFETLHKRKDGSLFNVEVTLKGMDFGPETWAIAIERDITERRRSEEALKNSEARYKALFEQTGDYIFLMEIPPGQIPIIRDINSSAMRVLSYSKEELVGKPISFIDPSSDPEKTGRLVRNLEEKKQYTFETIQRRKDGSLINVEALVKAVRIGTDPWFLAIHRDITDRKRAEEALLCSEARFHALFDHAVDSIFIFQLDESGEMVIVDANPSAVKMHGYTREELIGKPISLIDKTVTPEQAQMVKDKLSDVPILLHVKHQRKDGSVFDVEASVIKMVLNGKTVGVSFERSIPGQSGTSNAVCGVDDKFRVLSEELRESSEKIGAMNEKLRVVGSVTRHDVKNKLSIISANVYLLKKRLGGDPELLKYLDAISNAVTSSDKLFEFSRLYEKIGAEQLTEVNVEECFNEAVALQPNLVGVDIVNECSGLTVMADSLLRQLFYNLLDNSSKHGVKVTEVKLRFSKSESGIKLYYEDNGVGISDENKTKLFTEGFTTGNGSGLGLRLARKVVEVYGWSIAETGVAGSGVRFEISIK
jgi:PAS domain S-box